MRKKLEVVANLQAHYLVVWLVFFREFAVLDVDDVLPLHSLTIDHSKSQLSEKICLHIEEDSADSDLLEVVEQLYLVNKIHLLEIGARHLVVLDKACKGPYRRIR